MPGNEEFNDPPGVHGHVDINGSVSGSGPIDALSRDAPSYSRTSRLLSVSDQGVASNQSPDLDVTEHTKRRASAQILKDSIRATKVDFQDKLCPCLC